MHAHMLNTYRHKERAFLIRSKAVGNAHNTDKSRPHNTWAFANLLLVLLKSRNNQIAVQSYCFFLTYANKIVTK